MFTTNTLSAWRMKCGLVFWKGWDCWHKTCMILFVSKHLLCLSFWWMFGWIQNFRLAAIFFHIIQDNIWFLLVSIVHSQVSYLLIYYSFKSNNFSSDVFKDLYLQQFFKIMYLHFSLITLSSIMKIPWLIANIFSHIASTPLFLSLYQD